MAKARKTITKAGYEYYRKQLTNPDGSRTSIYAKTQSELNEKVKAHKRMIEGTTPRATTTVKDYASLQLDLMKVTVEHKTYIGYESKVRLYIIEPLGEMRLCDVKPDDIQRAMSRVAPLSASVYRTVHMLMRQIFKAAYRNRLIEFDPTEGLSSKGGKPPKERPPLSDDEANILLEAVAGLRAETFVLLGYGCGLRREEILALRWENVILDDEYPYLKIRQAWRVEHNQPVISDKLKSPAAKRDIPIPDMLATHLRALKAAGATDKSDYVIHNQAGGPLTETQFKNLWKQVSRRSVMPHSYVLYADGKKSIHLVTPVMNEAAAHNPEVKYTMNFKVTPHQLRHTYITNLIYAGLDPKTVQYLAGHENIKITMDIYAKVKYNRPQDLHGPVNAAFAKKGKELA